MFKKLTIIFLILLPGISIAQSDVPPVTMQMRNGKVYFDNAYSLNAGLKNDTLYHRALNWFNTAFPYPEKSIRITDIKKGEVEETGVFKIITSSSGHFYLMKFTLIITVHNATYEVKAFDFYEKPIEPGISNEYSKIEYRWWDYRQGKPWSVEDAVLFKGLNDDIKDMMVSLEKAMGK